MRNRHPPEDGQSFVTPSTRARPANVGVLAEFFVAKLTATGWSAGSVSGRPTISRPSGTIDCRSRSAGRLASAARDAAGTGSTKLTSGRKHGATIASRSGGTMLPAAQARFENAAPARRPFDHGAFFATGIFVMALTAIGLDSTTTAIASLRERNTFKLYVCLPVSRGWR